MTKSMFVMAVTLAGAMAGGLSGSQAHAADKKGSATGKGGSDEGTQYKAKTEYNFEDDDITGDLQRPDGELVDSLRKVKHSSLIEIRKDFIPEMLKSLEDV